MTRIRERKKPEQLSSPYFRQHSADSTYSYYVRSTLRLSGPRDSSSRLSVSLAASFRHTRRCLRTRDAAMPSRFICGNVAPSRRASSTATLSYGRRRSRGKQNGRKRKVIRLDVATDVRPAARFGFYWRVRSTPGVATHLLTRLGASPRSLRAIDSGARPPRKNRADLRPSSSPLLFPLRPSSYLRSHAPRKLARRFLNGERRIENVENSIALAR